MEDLTADELLAALPQAAAVCDADGLIREVNDHWVRFVADTPGRGDERGPGWNYLLECDRGCGSGSATSLVSSSEAGFAFRSVASGATPMATWEYTRQVDHADRWYRVEFTALPGIATRRGVLMSIHDVTSDRSVAEQLTRRAHHDQLTGLPDRPLFSELFAQAVALSSRHDEHVFLLACDLDHVSTINETFGHRVGDDLLRAVASRLTASVRSCDIVSRFGDDGFLVVLPDAEDSEVAERVASRLISDLARPFCLHGERLEVGLSVGIAVADDSDDLDAVIGSAGDAMFRAKAGGPNRVVMADEERVFAGRSGRRERLDVSQIDHEQLLSHFQPIIDLTDGSVVGVEALLRWSHPDYGIIPAADFLGLAANAGLIGAISDQALVSSTDTWIDLRDQVIGTPPQLFLNLSPAQLTSRSSIERLRHLLVATGLPPEELVLEITEEAMTATTRDLIDHLHALRDLGIRLAVDDFGSGHSSLGRLRHLPVQVLKIDRSLVRGVETDRRARQLLSSIGSMAVELEVSCVVEGCETLEEARVLEELGFRFAQGFHFARPMPPAELLEFLNSHSGRAPGSLG